MAREIDSSVSAVGQARSITAAAAIATSAALGGAVDRVGIRALMTWAHSSPEQP